MMASNRVNLPSRIYMVGTPLESPEAQQAGNGVYAASNGAGRRHLL